MMAKQLTEERYNELEGAVKGIAYKYGNKFGIDPEDLMQELWAKAIEIIRDEDEFNPDFIVKAFYNKAVDYYRYTRRRSESQLQDSAINSYDDEGSNNEWSSEDNESEFGSYNTFRNVEFSAIFSDMLDRFERGSREKLLFILKAWSTGAITEEELIESSDGKIFRGEDGKLHSVLSKNRIEEDHSYVDGYLLPDEMGAWEGRYIIACTQSYHYAWALGLSDSGSGSFRKINKNMKEIVAKWKADCYSL